MNTGPPASPMYPWSRDRVGNNLIAANGTPWEPPLVANDVGDARAGRRAEGDQWPPCVRATGARAEPAGGLGLSGALGNRGSHSLPGLVLGVPTAASQASLPLGSEDL